MAVEPLTRREFLDLSWKSALLLVLAGCSPAPKTPTTASAAQTNQIQPILDFTRPLSGSTTVESLLPQHWYVATQTGFNLIDQSVSKLPPPVVNQPKAAYVSPEAYFRDAPINFGDGKKYKVGGELPDGKYQYVPVAVMQTMAISPGQLVQLEGATTWSSVYETTINGIALSGILIRTSLIGALANASISGALQREIEGPRMIRWVDEQGDVKLINLDDPRIESNARTIQISQSKSNAADKVVPKFQIEISGSSYIPPNDWKPPSKNHCGEDLVELFARLYFSSISAEVFVESLNPSASRDPKAYDKAYNDALKSPILQKTDENERRINEIDENLRKKGCYFYPEGGSVFMDYKLMRERAFLKVGKYSKPDIRRDEFEQIWKNDASMHQAYRKGVNEIDAGFKGPDGKFNKNMSADQALQLARQLIEKLWW